MIAPALLLPIILTSPLQRTAIPSEETVTPSDYLVEHILAEKAQVVKLAGDMQFTEGPVWVPDGNYLVFSDIPADELKRWKDGKLTTFRKPSRNANGNLLDEKGALITCEHGSRTLTLTDNKGNCETLVGDFKGKKLNSPNDLAIRSDGMIWFTDPPYGLRGRPRELEKNNVFCFDRESGTLKVVASDFDRPNGICLSPKEDRLYIADSGKPRHIRVFDVSPDGSLAKGRVFCRIDNGGPDGIRCDSEGRIFSSAGDGVHVFAPEGKLLGRILVPEQPSNLCFGGPKGTTLFITARRSLYSIELKVRDARDSWREKTPASGR
jgi:gluconolactonase